MRIRNWTANPKADVLLSTWSGKPGVGSYTRNSDGTCTYTRIADGVFTLNPFNNQCVAGYADGAAICAIRFREPGNPSSAVIGLTVMRDGTTDGIWAWENTIKSNGSFWSPAFYIAQDKTLTPLALGIFAPDDWRIMQMLGLNLFDAETASYGTLSAPGGGVFFLALVILSGGWSHENREPIRRSELREKPRHVGSFRMWHECDSLAGRPALEIRIVVSRHGGPGESAGRRGMCRLEPPSGVFVEEHQYGVICRLDRRRFGRGEHQWTSQSSVRFPLHGKCGRDGGGTVLLHARGMVVHPDGGRDHLRRRHRTVLDAGLVVA